MQRPQAAYLPDGRLHLQHGPIDLIIGADGPAETAFVEAKRRFETVLHELVAELPALRAELDASTHVTGDIAGRMCRAAAPFVGMEPLSPMIAVAGAVADEILTVMKVAGPMDRAYVNNGGDISLHLSPGARFDIALSDHDGRRLGTARIEADTPVRGVATSGHWGRSLSLGIADAVTVLAADAAIADAAATLIANAIDLPDHPGIQRAAATDLQPDSDLGDRMAVTYVPPLQTADCARALERGRRRADAMLAAGHIRGAALFLQGQAVMLGHHVTYLGGSFDD